MSSGTWRTLILLAGGAVATAAWAAVFPFLYADISTARHLGAGVAAGAFTAFAIGSVIAAPGAGWLADRVNPLAVAMLARLGLAACTVALGLATTPSGIWLATAGFGAAQAVTQPAVQVILLHRTPAHRRRDVFAWQFVAINLGAAAGAAIAGPLVDLSSQAAMRPVYEVAVVLALLSAAIVPLAGRSAAGGSVLAEDVGSANYRQVLASAKVRWLLGVALLITLACYAQYDAGLPAYLLAATTITPAQLGIAVALNAVLVAGLTTAVVTRTRGVRSTSLLAICAGIWVVCWLLFGLPLVLHGHDSSLTLLSFAVMSVGETMMAPILAALAAALAPKGAAGRTMAAVGGASTLATAVGPLLAGALLGLHLPAGFIAMQIVFCIAAAMASIRLSRLLPKAVSRPGTTELAASQR